MLHLSFDAKIISQEYRKDLPVAMMIDNASTSLSSVKTLNGLRDRSIFVTVSEKICVPNRSLCDLR